MAKVKPSDHNTIKEWLFPLMEARNLSVERLARQAGLTRSSLYYYLNDIRRPTSEAMRRICDVLQVPHEQGLSQYTDKPNGRPTTKGDDHQPKI